MKIVSIIPARGGSKGIPNKNVANVMGKRLIEHVIGASLSSNVAETYVSTDSDMIEQVSLAAGANVIRRPDELASDTASSESVLLHFANTVDFDILVFLQCTSPLTSSKDINGAISMLDQYDSVLSATKDHGGFLCGGFTWSGDGRSINYDYKTRQRRQDIKDSYRENGAIYVMTKKGLLEHKNRLHGSIGIFEMPLTRSFEIDSVEDLELINKIGEYL